VSSLANDKTNFVLINRLLQGDADKNILKWSATERASDGLNRFVRLVPYPWLPIEKQGDSFQ
jgi:hypothetical protein